MKVRLFSMLNNLDKIEQLCYYRLGWYSVPQIFSFKDLQFTIRVHPCWKVFVSNFLKRIRNSALESIRLYFFLNENEYPQRYFYDFEPYQLAGFTPGDFLSKRLPVEATSCRGDFLSRRLPVARPLSPKSPPWRWSTRRWMRISLRTRRSRGRRRARKRPRWWRRLGRSSPPLISGWRGCMGCEMW